MDNRSKKVPKFGPSKIMFTPNLGYKRNVAKDSNQQIKVEVKIEREDSTSPESSNQKQRKAKERSTTQVQSVFSNMGSTSSGSSRIGSSGFRFYSRQGGFNKLGSFVKTEACQSIQQMQLLEYNQFEVDDPMDDTHGPVRLPLFKKDRIPQIKSENSLEYPLQKNVYPSLSELLNPESLMTIQFYDSSFSSQPKIPDIDLTDNDNNDKKPVKLETNVPIKLEYNGYNKTENDTEANLTSKPIGKVQYYRSGRVVLKFNEKEYELLKANEDKHHKELFSLTKIEDAERPDKLVSLGIIPSRLKAVMDINSIIDQFLTINN